MQVIHQPRYSIFSLFDDVTLLGKGGRLVYMGPSGLCLPYFETLGFRLPANENPADFCLDIISGSVAGEAGGEGDSVRPEELPALWLSLGGGWVATQSRLLPADAGRGGRGPADAPRLDPEQLALLEEQFQAKDGDGDGALTAAELRELLLGLGLQPSAQDMGAIMAELAPRTGMCGGGGAGWSPRLMLFMPANTMYQLRAITSPVRSAAAAPLSTAGLVPQDTFLQYVRYGGRPPASDTIPAARRRVDSLYRVYSIEQYNLTSALADRAGVALPPGLRRAATLRELALLTAAQHAAQAAAQREASESASLEGSSQQGSSQQGPLASSGEGEPALPASFGAGGGKVPLPALPRRRGPDSSSSSDEPLEIHIPPQQPLDKEWASLAGPKGAAVPKTDSSTTLGGLPDAARGGEGQGGGSSAWAILSCCGLLERRSASLRTTPGVFATYFILLARAGTKFVRGWGSKFAELLLLLFAGVVTGGCFVF